jgi:hypothetical protein
LHHVRVGDDVASGIDDHAGSDSPLANDEGRGAMPFVGRRGAVAGNLDLHHSGRDPLRDLRQRTVQLPQGSDTFAGLGWLSRLGTASGGGQQKRRSDDQSIIHAGPLAWPSRSTVRVTRYGCCIPTSRFGVVGARIGP